MPNPNKGVFQVVWSNEQKNEWEMKDIYGKTISIGTAQRQLLLDITEFPSGLYLFMTSANGKKTAKKIIKD